MVSPCQSGVTVKKWKAGERTVVFLRSSKRAFLIAPKFREERKREKERESEREEMERVK